MNIQAFTFNPFMENTYVLYDENGCGVIVDPGCYTDLEKHTLQAFIQKENIQIEAVLLTHGHLDHVFGLAFVVETYKVPAYHHSLDHQTLFAFSDTTMRYGVPNTDQIDHIEMKHLGDNVSFGNVELEVRFVPGHAPGHVVFVHHPTKTIINGDCLFDGGIGRTDLPGGDHQTLLNSIREELFTLPEDYIVYCGHGGKTTIGKEKTSNPFLI